MTPSQQQALRDLRDAGYAVILWTPAELGEASPQRVEDRSIELGYQIIEDLGGRDFQGGQRGGATGQPTQEAPFVMVQVPCISISHLSPETRRVLWQAERFPDEMPDWLGMFAPHAHGFFLTVPSDAAAQVKDFMESIEVVYTALDTEGREMLPTAVQQWLGNRNTTRSAARFVVGDTDNGLLRLASAVGVQS